MTSSPKKRVLVTGAKGMLGTDIVATFSSANFEVIPMDIGELDITSEKDCIRIVAEIKPEIIVNCAAYTNVDACETNRELAFAVNAEGVRNLAVAANSIGAKLVHYSTDYIFDGKKNGPYIEEDVPNPLNVYGASKLAGERYVQQILGDYLIIRTTWLFGKNGKNFVSTILKLAQERKELKIVNDQFGAPTYTVDLAEATLHLVRKQSLGIVNVTNSGECSWFDFTKKILHYKENVDVIVTPITSKELHRLAVRPANSRLASAKFNMLVNWYMPDWSDGLRRYLLDII